MPSNFIENPELNKLYLIKRNKSGDPSKRFQPGTIVEITNSDCGKMAEVHWLFDGSIEQNVLMFYGLTKDLTHKWIDVEAKRKDVELKALRIAISHLDQLRFNPQHMVKITA